VTYDPTTPTGQVRLLVNDTGSDPVFEDGDILGFLALEGQNVKRAAAQALDVIADDEALTGKVISSEGNSTNGPAVAASLRARATTLRQQALYDLAQDDDESFFEIIPMTPAVSVDPFDSPWGGLV
jgi:hypothetical protein